MHGCSEAAARITNERSAAHASRGCLVCCRPWYLIVLVCPHCNCSLAPAPHRSHLSCLVKSGRAARRRCCLPTTHHHLSAVVIVTPSPSPSPRRHRHHHHGSRAHHHHLVFVSRTVPEPHRHRTAIAKQSAPQSFSFVERRVVSCLSRCSTIALPLPLTLPTPNRRVVNYLNSNSTDSVRHRTKRDVTVRTVSRTYRIG